MFHSLFRLFLSVFSGKESRGNDRRTSLFLEGLEDRIVPAIWIVSDLGDAGQGNVMAQEGDLRFCMNKSASGDTINFNKSGTISLTAQLPTISKNLTIAAGSQNVTIQGNGGAGGGYRIFNIVSNDTKYNVEIDNLTIKGGWANGGGGIDNYGNLTLKNDNINNNQSTTVGGGIENDPGSTLTLSGDVIENNAATNEGGGIENFGTMNNIAGTSTTIADNQAKQGGGIVNCVNASTYFVNSVYIEGNTASTGNGGGVLNETNAVFSMVDGTIGNNVIIHGSRLPSRSMIDSPAA